MPVVSNQRRFRRDRERRIMALVARSSGCTCARAHVRRKGDAWYEIVHDHGCPMVDHASQLVLYDTPRDCERP